VKGDEGRRTGEKGGGRDGWRLGGESNAINLLNFP